MSEGLMAKLGKSKADLVPVKGAGTVGTAKEGSGLKVLGRLKEPLQLQLGAGIVLRTRPIVLRGLAMPLNLSGPYLKAQGIDQIHSKDCLQINGQVIPLVKDRQKELIGQIQAELYIKEDQVIPSCSVAHVAVIAPDIRKRNAQFLEGIVEGSFGFMEENDLHPWRRTIQKFDLEGNAIVGVMNTTGQDIKISKGSKYGTVYAITDKADDPFERIHVIQNGVDDADVKAIKGGLEDLKQKKKKLVEALKLKDSPFLKDPAVLSRAVEFLVRYWELFSFDGSFGKTDLLKHSIRLQEGKHHPINQRYRPLNPSLEKSLKDQIDVWTQQDVIEKSRSPWNFALVAAPKKNGKVRWCVDYRPLNAVTVRDTHPIGHIEDNLSRLAHSRVFSGIDGSGAFHVIELEKDDREKTAFATPWGSYHFKRMPFGLCGGPSTYARLVQMVLDGIPHEMALPYLDDTIIHSRTMEQHFQALEIVFKAHLRAGLKLQPEKCQLFRSSIDYLGHVVSSEGIHPIPEYLDVVATWPTPKTRSQVRTFLGKVGYYRRFIPQYAAIAGPLSDKLVKDEKDDNTEFEITPEIERSFQDLKSRLTSAPILAYPEFDSEEPFILDTDWSLENNAIGAVLSQKQNGLERVIAYGAKKLSPNQRNYPSTKGELCAIIYFLDHWKYYLQFRKFTLRTDNQALTWIKTMQAPKGMIQRWLDILANYDFDIEHRAGKSHGNADSLSRAEHLSPSGTEVDVSLGERVCVLMDHGPWVASKVAELQDIDPDIDTVKKAVKAKDPLTDLARSALSSAGKIYAGLFDSLYIDSQGVLRQLKVDSFVNQPVETHPMILPRELWYEALQKAHLASAHQGAAATVERAQKHVYFPNMLRQAKELILSCTECQSRQGRQTDQRHTLVSHQTGYPFQKISVDFVGPLATSHRGNKYIFTVRDTFSRWLEAFPLKTATADNVVYLLEKEIFSRFGIPDQIHSDRGTQFTGDLLNAVAQRLGIRVTHTPAYNPKSNPVERAHRDMEKAITALVKGRQQDWEKVLPQVLFALRSARCRSTGFAPYQLLFGRQPLTSLDLIFTTPQPNVGYSTHHEYAKALQLRIQEAETWARENMRLTIDRQRRAYHAEHKSLIPGQQVWLYTPTLKPGQSSKFAKYWTGPWTIDRKLNDLMYVLHPDPLWTRKGQEVVSIDRLRLYYPPQDSSLVAENFPPADDADLSLPGDEFAEHFPADDDYTEADRAPALPLDPVPVPVQPPILPVQPEVPAPPQEVPVPAPPVPVVPLQRGAQIVQRVQTPPRPVRPVFQEIPPHPVLRPAPPAQPLRPLERQRLFYEQERAQLQARRDEQANTRAQRAARRALRDQEPGQAAPAPAPERADLDEELQNMCDLQYLA